MFVQMKCTISYVLINCNRIIYNISNFLSRVRIIVVWGTTKVNKKNYAAYPVLCTFNNKTYGNVQMYGNHLWLKTGKMNWLWLYINKYMMLCFNNLAINIQLNLQVHWRVAVYEQSKEFISIIPNERFNLAYSLRITAALLFQSEAL